LFLTYVSGSLEMVNRNIRIFYPFFFKIIVLINFMVTPISSNAQTPIKLKLIGAFLDSNGLSFDTLYFGFNKDGGAGVQEGLDVLDTAKNKRWGTTDPSTPGLYYKTNIREFEPYTYTKFDIYTNANLRYISWDTAEYNPSFYNFDFVRLAVSLSAEDAFFEFPEVNSFGISGSLYQWKESNGVNPQDSVSIIVVGLGFKLSVFLGVKDSIPTSVKKELANNLFSFYQILGTNEINLINPQNLNLSAELINLQGQSVLNLTQLIGSITQFPINGLPSGIYYLKVFYENTILLKPIIIY
jgi:hypothetical protein